jgi:hypothetical protein
MGLIPIPLLFGLLAESITLTSTMLWVRAGAILVMMLIAWRLPESAPEKGAQAS